MSKKRRTTSRSRKSSSQSNDALVQGALSLLFKNPALGLGIVVIGAIAALAYFFLLEPTTQQPTTDGKTDEQIAAEIGRVPETPSFNVPTVPGGLGSGLSVRTDWYELHFNSPVYPTKKENYVGGLDEKLVAMMNRATLSMDVAIYDFDLLNMAQAMAAAKKRGVTVRMVTDSDTVKNKDEEIQKALEVVRGAQIPIVEDNRGPIMHHKFTVVDREWISTGSWNYTYGDTYRLNNHMIIIKNRQLADNYTATFEKMFTKKQFGPTKDKGIPNPVVTVGNVRMQNYFASEDDVQIRVVETVQSAKQSVYFMAFSFTDDLIGDAIMAKAKAGLRVQGVFEKTGSTTQFSEFGRMKEAGLDVYTDGSPYALHHKVIIVDERLVVFGSFNFSENAEKSNDENMLIVDDANMAKAFKAEYDKILDVAKNPPKR
jgi:phosphatidylserine/phosphatidylglycerophosphate/cardiolipin synthase-like enzyme